MDKRQLITSLFNVPRALVGMLHLPPLPGSPQYCAAGNPGLKDVEATVVNEAKVYQQAGFHGLIIENMHDRPYLKGSVGPETVAAMAVIGQAVRKAVPLPLGVQVLAGANCEAIAVALGCGGSFVRVEG